ncbi:hypothetical protein C1H76_4324 [Elsinoe australis]|uniref:Uncharacterized protein n=1 Tax=Elsinoe australis TaxID=40998 RepID=A0A4U7B6X3_9PEZI|nr:hypothetical protein C1H76_4324 [Elsinoe australis]
MPHNDANDPHDAKTQHHHERYSKPSSSVSEARPRMKRKRDLANGSPSWNLPKQSQQQAFEPPQPSDTGPRKPTGPKQPQKQPSNLAQLLDATPETAQPPVTDLKPPTKPSPSPNPLPASQNEAWKHFIFGSEPPEEDGDSPPAHNSAPSQITHDHLHGKATAPRQDLDTLSLAPIVSSSSDGADVEVGTGKTPREACLGRGGDGLSIRVQVDRHREREWSSIWGAGRYCDEEENEVEGRTECLSGDSGTSGSSESSAEVKAAVKLGRRSDPDIAGAVETSSHEQSVEGSEPSGRERGATTRWWRNGRRVHGRSKDRDGKGREAIEISSEEEDQPEEEEEEEEEEESESDGDGRG